MFTTHQFDAVFEILPTGTEDAPGRKLRVTVSAIDTDEAWKTARDVAAQFPGRVQVIDVVAEAFTSELPQVRQLPRKG